MNNPGNRFQSTKLITNEQKAILAERGELRCHDPREGCTPAATKTTCPIEYKTAQDGTRTIASTPAPRTTSITNNGDP